MTTVCQWLQQCGYFVLSKWGCRLALGLILASHLAPVLGLSPKLQLYHYGLVNTKGEIVLVPTYDEIGPFSATELASVVLSDSTPDHRRRAGYINTGAEIVILPQYQEARSFARNGLAAVKQAGMWGYIDVKGKWRIEPKFGDGIGIFTSDFDDQGLAIVRLGKVWGIISSSGAWVLEPKYDRIYPFGECGAAPFEWGDLWGFLDRNGKILVDYRYYSLQPCTSNGLAAVGIDGLFGFVDMHGSVRIAPIFSWAWPFGEGGVPSNRAIAAKAGKVLVIDEQGRLVSTLPFSAKYIPNVSFHYGLTVAISPQNSDEGTAVPPKWTFGYMDLQGRMIIPTIYSEAKPFSADGFAHVRIGDRWGYIDQRGKRVSPFTTDEYAEYPIKHPIRRKRVGDKIGFINTRGDFVVPAQFDIAEDFDDLGFARVGIKTN